MQTSLQTRIIEDTYCRTGYATAHSAILSRLFTDASLLDEMSVVAAIPRSVAGDVRRQWRLSAEPALLAVPRMTAVPADWDSRREGWSIVLDQFIFLHISRLFRRTHVGTSSLDRRTSTKVHERTGDRDTSDTAALDGRVDGRADVLLSWSLSRRLVAIRR